MTVVDAAGGAPPSARLRLLLVVATFYPDSYGGAERQARILAEALAPLGVETRIVAPTTTAGLPAIEPTAFGAIERVAVRDFPNYGGRRIGSTLAWTREVVRRFGGAERADVLYVFHARLHVLPALLLKLRTGAPLLIKLGGGGEASDFAALKAKRFLYGRMALAAVLRLTDGFVANSAQIEDDLRALHVPPERVLAFPNGVELPPLARLDAAEATRRGGRFVFCGRMVPDKSVATLFEAARILLAEGRELHLSFLGDGPEQARLQALAEAGGVAHAFSFPGRCADVYPALFASDVFASASEREGQSNALIEAMSAGCIPLVFAASGAGDLVEDGRTGFLVGEGTPAAFADAMRRALDLAPEARRAVGRAARARIEATSGIARIAARTRAAFDALLGARRP